MIPGLRRSCNRLHSKGFPRVDKAEIMGNRPVVVVVVVVVVVLSQV